MIWHTLGKYSKFGTLENILDEITFTFPGKSSNWFVKIRAVRMYVYEHGFAISHFSCFFQIHNQKCVDKILISHTEST